MSGQKLGDVDTAEPFGEGAPPSPLSGSARKGRIELNLAERTSAPPIDAASALGTALSQLVLTPPPRSSFRADAPVFVPGMGTPGALDFDTPVKVGEEEDFVEMRSRMLRVRQLLADEEEVSFIGGKMGSDSPIRLSTAKRLQANFHEDKALAGAFSTDFPVPASRPTAHIGSDPILAALNVGMNHRPKSPAKVPLTPGPQPPRQPATTSRPLESSSPVKALSPPAFVVEPSSFTRGPMPAGQVTASKGKGGGKGDARRVKSQVFDDKAQGQRASRRPEARR